MLGQLAAFLSTGGHLVHVFPTAEDVRVGPANTSWGPTAVPDQAALEQADVVLHVGLDALGDLLATLDTRRSRARAVVALPTVAAAGRPPVSTQALEASIAGAQRRVVASADSRCARGAGCARWAGVTLHADAVGGWPPGGP